MRKLQFKRDPWVIGPYTLFVTLAFVAFFLKQIDWKVLTGFLTALNLPAAFGLKEMLRGDEESHVPPEPPTKPELPESGPDTPRL